MRALRMFPLLLLFLMFGGPILLTANSAYARCCMCGACGGGCTCPGTYPCGWCAMPVPEQLQISGAFSERTPNETVADEQLVSPLVIDSRSIDRLIRSAGIGQCGRINSRIALMEGFKAITIDEHISEQGATQQTASADGDRM
jgi:hypothetical protein